MLVNMLGSFLGSENLPASGPDFDGFAGELARTLWGVLGKDPGLKTMYPTLSAAFRAGARARGMRFT
jgi:hypothetical protein